MRSWERKWERGNIISLLQLFARKKALTPSPHRASRRAGKPSLQFFLSLFLRIRIVIFFCMLLSFGGNIYIYIIKKIDEWCSRSLVVCLLSLGQGNMRCILLPSLLLVFLLRLMSVMWFFSGFVRFSDALLYPGIQRRRRRDNIAYNNSASRCLLEDDVMCCFFFFLFLFLLVAEFVSICSCW
jgi:hypothetical protein